MIWLDPILKTEYLAYQVRLAGLIHNTCLGNQVGLINHTTGIPGWLRHSQLACQCCLRTVGHILKVQWDSLQGGGLIVQVLCLKAGFFVYWTLDQVAMLFQKRDTLGGIAQSGIRRQRANQFPKKKTKHGREIC